MKNLVFLILSGLSLTASAQDFSGYRSGNYTGVNGVFFNPANIADNRYRFDINLLSLSTLAGNDQASFRLKNISRTFQGDSIKNQLFGENAGPATGTFSADIHGPSVMFGIGKKNAFAITTRARIFASVVDVDGELFDQLTKDFSNDPTLPYTISSSQNMRVAVNVWSEFGLSFGRVITSKGPHFLKGGITVKYLAGAGNGYVNIDNFNGTIDDDLLLQDVYLQNTTGRIATGFGGIRISDFEAGDLTKMESTGIGADIGFVYEYRPEATEEKDEKSKKTTTTGYKFKFGAALLDLGRIKYTKDMQRSGSYDMDITGSERLSLQELSEVDLDDYNDFFSSRPQYFTPVAGNAETEYSVSLPTTLQLEADYHAAKGFYVNLSSQISLSNNTKGYNNQSYSSVTLTPRFEGKRIGFYLPLNYNELTKINAGASIRVGPFFAGSGSVLSALVGESKQADVYFGFRFGGLK